MQWRRTILFQSGKDQPIGGGLSFPSDKLGEPAPQLLLEQKRIKPALNGTRFSKITSLHPFLCDPIYYSETKTTRYWGVCSP